jgi:hypothetical protein
MSSTYHAVRGELVECDAGREVGVIDSQRGTFEQETEASSLDNDLLGEGRFPLRSGGLGHDGWS